MTHTLDSVQTKELDRRAAARLAWTLSSDSYLCDDPVEDFARRGFSQYAPRTKAAGLPITMADTAVALLPLSAAFVGQADRESVIDRLRGAVRLDLAAAARLQDGTITATVVGEGDEKPVSALTFALPPSPTKVSAQIVASMEAWAALGATQTGLTRVLLSAVGRGTDDVLVAALTAAGPSTVPTSGRRRLIGSNASPTSRGWNLRSRAGRWTKIRRFGRT
jgi:hypothetical protein